MWCEGWDYSVIAYCDAVEPSPLQLHLGITITAVQSQNMEVGLFGLGVFLEQIHRRGVGTG